MIGTPGLAVFGSLGAGPVRALWAGNTRLFAVGGAHVYEVNPTTGVVITDFGAMAGSSGTGMCQIVANAPGPGSSNQLLVMDPSVPAVFNIDPVGPAVTKVFDGFSLEYLDTFFFSLNSTIVNQINQSGSLDGTTWDPLAFAIRSGVADAVTGLAVSNSNLWIFGQKNTEVWYDAGNAGFSLARITGGTIVNGAYSKPGDFHAFSITKVDNTLMWLGFDERGYGVFYKANGFTPIRVSNYAIEALLLTFGDISDCRAFSYQEDGHLFSIFNFPNALTGIGATIGYDHTTQMWHRRGFLSSGVIQRALPDCFAAVPIATGVQNIVGDYQSANMYKMGLQYTSDIGAAIKRVRTTPHVSNSNEWLPHNFLRMDADIGSANMFLTWSNDGGLNFTGGTGNAIPKTGTAAATGINNYQQWQLGRSRDRVYTVTITDAANKIRLVNGYLSVGAG